MDKKGTSFLVKNNHVWIESSYIETVLRIKDFKEKITYQGSLINTINHFELNDNQEEQFVVIINYNNKILGLLVENIVEPIGSFVDNEFVSKLFVQYENLAVNVKLKEKNKIQEKQIEFQIDGLFFSIPISETREILDFPFSLEPSFFDTGDCLGQIELREKKILIFSLGKLFNLDNPSYSKIILITHEDVSFGIAVSSVNQLINKDRELCENHITRDFLIKNSEIDFYIKSHNTVYNLGYNQKKSLYEKPVKYLMFKCDFSFALPLLDVSFVHKVSQEDLKNGYCLIRNKKIKIENFKKFKDFNNNSEENQLILIVLKNNENFGFLIDELSEVISLCEKDKLKSSLFKESSNYSSCISGFVSNSTTKTVLLDSLILCEKLSSF